MTDDIYKRRSKPSIIDDHMENKPTKTNKTPTVTMVKPVNKELQLVLFCVIPIYLQQ